MITLLTEWLYIAAQMPHGTHAQQNVFRAAQRAGRFGAGARDAGPGRERLAAELRDRGAAAGAGRRCRARSTSTPSSASEAARQRREQPAPAAAWPRAALPGRRAWSRAATPPSTRSRPSPRSSRTSAGAARRTGSSSPTPTSRSPTSARADDSRTRYWNTGSWIYEPDLGSRQAYARYLRYAWPGTAVVIDDEEPEPRLLELLADLNPALA